MKFYKNLIYTTVKKSDEDCTGGFVKDEKQIYICCLDESKRSHAVYATQGDVGWNT